MAKDEAERLQQRVADLESELTRMQAEHDALSSVADHEQLMRTSTPTERVLPGATYVSAPPSDPPTPPTLDPREAEPEPGEGPTLTVSASMHRGTVDAVRAKAGKRGFSRYVEAAVLRQIRRDNLRELLDDFERVAGPADQTALEEARAFLRGETMQQDLAS